jgi:hypothetical protein
MVLETKWPVLARHDRAAEWLQVWTDLGRAPRTIDAYARGLVEYLVMCDREGVDPVTANRAHVAVYVRELTQRPSLRGVNMVSIDSGSGLANATIQQRLSCRSGCSMTSSSKKVCASPIRSAGESTRPAGSGATSAAFSVAWCPADQASVDPQRPAVDGCSDRRPQRAGAQPCDARAGLRRRTAT